VNRRTTTQWPKEKGQKDKTNDLQTTQKTIYQASRSPQGLDSGSP